MKKPHFLSEMRDFLILWSGQSLSALGSSMTSYALILWVYQQENTATSIALLSFFTYLPSILFSFIAGTLSDRWDKKKTMLISDLIAALGTCGVFLLFQLNQLQVWHLYLVNFLISFMNAFQGPASYVTTTMLVPRQHYNRASGLQGISSSAVRILTPALATMVMAFGDLRAVFTIDLITFLLAAGSLLLFVRIPKVAKGAAEKAGTFLASITEGIRFLLKKRPLFVMILYMSLINLLAYTSGYGILPAMILSRSGNNETLLGIVSSAIGVGMLVGSVIVTLTRPAKRKTRLVFCTMALSFLLGDIVWGLGKTGWLWVFAGFAGNVLVPFTNACMFTLMRENVPTPMQGRVFAARDTLQYFTIPIALFMGGYLADYVFEPLMAGSSPLRDMLAAIFGSGSGSGMAIIFFITGAVGVISSLICLRTPMFKELDTPTPK